MDKKLIIIISAILIVAIIGMLIFSNITGYAITGSSVKQEIKNEYFEMDIFEDMYHYHPHDDNHDYDHNHEGGIVNDTQNISG